jgi:2-keto-4-pentenoate hydratase/2-oxohepta-3-ene-1,7-dioic acid hydratase in catechol pathway
MKLATFGDRGALRLGAALDDAWLDITDYVRSIAGTGSDDEMIALIRKGPTALEQVRTKLESNAASLQRINSDALEWLSPVIAPSKIVCIALNNRALDAVKLRAPTDHPAFFTKSQNSLVGHKQPIPLRRAYGLTHPEPELAVVIGAKLKNASPTDAIAGVFGYTIMNDITSVGMREEDSFSFRYFRADPAGGKPIEGEGHSTYPGRYKGADGFAPLGPWIVTRDEIADPDNLNIKCWLGDLLVASDNTSSYVWSVANAISHVTRTMTLLPGDIVSMGTAAGGDADDPLIPEIPGVTKANLIGHVGTVSVEISGLGRLTNPIETTGD